MKAKPYLTNLLLTAACVAVYIAAALLCKVFKP